MSDQQQQHDALSPRIESDILSTPIVSADLRLSLPPTSDCGGYVCFEGLVRNINHGKTVVRLEYEAYGPLAKKELSRICEEAAAKFELRFVRTLHREGSLEIGDVAVIVQVLSRHRGEAFAGCRYIIDELKSRVPIWKNEHYEDGTHDWTRCNHAKEPHNHSDGQGHQHEHF